MKYQYFGEFEIIYSWKILFYGKPKSKDSLFVVYKSTVFVSLDENQLTFCITFCLSKLSTFVFVIDGGGS